MKHIKPFKLLNESLVDEDFDVDLSNIEVTVDNMPKDWEDRSLNVAENGNVKWKLSFDVNKSGLAGFIVEIKSLSFDGMFDDDQELKFEVTNASAELLNVAKSFYATYIEVDMKNDKDTTKWTVIVYFGTPE